MTEDVNQNENELFDDGGGNQPQVQPQQQKKAFDAKNYLNTRLADNEQKRTVNIRTR